MLHSGHWSAVQNAVCDPHKTKIEIIVDGRAKTDFHNYEVAIKLIFENQTHRNQK